MKQKNSPFNKGLDIVSLDDKKAKQLLAFSLELKTFRALNFYQVSVSGLQS